MYRLGIDLGGTNIVAGVVDENFKIVSKAQTKTAMPRSADEIADDMAAVALKAANFAGVSFDEIDGFGVGAPGSASPEEGIIIYANNLDFYNVPLGEMMFKRTGKKFSVANDADCAAYGEFIAGAGRGTKDFIMITLGTGVGSGIILGGKLITGFNGGGCELGHTVIQMNGEACTCGRNGCFEAYASATALIRQTKQMMIMCPDSVMWDLCGGDINKVSGRTSFDAMRKGDPAGKRVVDRYIEYISVGVTNAINSLQPEVLCIGGGISKEGDTLIKPLEQLVRREDYSRNMERKTAVRAAQLGNDAGIIGAAYFGK